MNNCRKMAMSILSVVLVLIMAFTLPLQVAANMITDTDNISENSLDNANQINVSTETETESGNIIGEDKTKRDEYTKYFITDAGTTIAAQYAVPVHYKDASGEYVDFDNSLISSEVTVSSATQDEATADEVSAYSLRASQETVQTEEILTNKKSDSKVSHLKKSGKGKLVEITKDGYTISWGYSGANIVDAKEQNHSSQELTGNDAYLSLQNLSSTVLYENIYNNIDLEVINSTTGVKENIILKDSNAKNVFNIEYNIGALTAVSIDSRTIFLKDSTDEVKFIISAPYMVDANGEQSESLELKILKNNKGKLSVKLTADKTWLSDFERVYPVTIDPHFEYGQDWGTLNSTYVSGHAASSNFGGIGSIYVGRPENDGEIDYVRRSLVKIPNLPVLNNGDMVVGAYLALWQSNNAPTIDMNVGIYEAAGSWTQNGVTWNNQPGYSSNLIDYEVCEAYTYGWRDWDITELVKSWYNGNTNNGFYLVMMDEANVNQGIKFLSSSYPSNDQYKPALVVEYRNNKGLESYWSYTPVSIGGAGTAYINDYSGNLVFQTSLADTHGLKLPVSTHLTYNSYMADASYRGTASYWGYGWKMNLQQAVMKTGEYSEQNGVSGSYPYVYSDADGTDHYFYKKTDSTTNTVKYLDEDGLDIEVVENDDEYIITDNDNTQYHFNKTTNLLTLIRNSSEKEIKLQYSEIEANKVTQITDGDNNCISITYDDNGKAETIKDPSERSIVLGYNAQEEYLTSITRPDGNTSYFEYDSNGLLTKVTGADDRYTTFTYSQYGSKGITSVQEFDKDGNPGQKITYNRTKYNTTEIRSSGKDCVYGNSDDIITTYQFDNWGKATSVWSKTAGGKSLGASSATYTSSEINSDASNIKAINKVTSSYSQGSNKENLVNGHNMDDLNNWTTAYWIANTIDFTATINTEEKNVLFGNGSLAINVDSVSGDARGRVRQDIDATQLTQGATYTLSAYVKTENLTPVSGATDYGALIAITPLDSDSSTSDIYSDHISTNTSSEINKGFRRISITFTMPENSTFTGVRIQLALRGAEGTAYFDGIQLEKADAPSNYNMIENASLERYANSGVPTSWHGSSTLTMSTSYDTKSTAHVDGSASFRIRGNIGTRKNIYQDIPVAKGDTEKETYILSGWATAYAVPKETNSSCFRLLARVYYSDNTYKNNNIYFNTTLTQGTWQFATSAFTLSDGTNTVKTPSFIRVYLSYDKQGNYAYFDNLSLTKEAVASYTYDDNGDLISVVENAQQEAAYVYDDNRLTKYTDPEGGSYEYTYYDTKLLKTAKTQSDAVYTYTYDDAGNATSVEASAPDTDYLKSEMEYSYPATVGGDYSVTAKDQDGRTYTETYNGETGTLKSTTDPNNVTTTYTYDPDTDFVTAIANGDQSVTYEYDNYGKLTKISHEGTDYTFTYDAFGKRIATKVGNRTLSTNSYMANNGSLVGMTYGNGDTVSYTYDDYGNIATMSYGEDEVVKNFSDSAGNINRTQDLLTNLEHRVTYDSTGRLVSKETLDLSTSGDKWLRSLEYDYDKNNNVTKFAVADKDGSSVTTFEYGDDNLPSKTVLPNDKNITYTYDKLGRITGKSLDTTTPLSYTYTYADSLRGTVDGKTYTTTKLETETVGGVTYKYTYDAVGNITNIIKVNADNTETLLCSYTYDGYNQLTQVDDYENSQQLTFTYNQAGNITRRCRYQMNSSWAVQSTLENVRYVYGDAEWKDLLTTYGGQAITYDAIGNPLSYRDGISFTWQNGRELASYTKNSTTVTYTYDANGLRTSKNIGGVATFNYTYEGSQLLSMEYMEYVYDLDYDANGNAAGFTLTDTADDTSTYYYYLLNSRGDVIAICNSQGVKVATYSYDAYGKLLSTNFTSEASGYLDSAAVNYNPLRYRSYVYDHETGLYYLQSRYYDPITCRFVGADTTDILTATFTAHTDKNLFAYCDNNPISRIDTDGDFWEAIGIGFVAGLVGQYISDVVENVQEGKTGIKIFKPTSSASEYISSGLGGAVAAVPGLKLIGTMSVGAVGSVISDGLKGNINSWEDFGESAFRGAIANGIGYSFAKGMAVLKVKQISNMPRSNRKIYLRDTFYASSQANANVNLKTFANSSISSKIGILEKQVAIFRSGIYSTFVSTISTLFKREK